MDISFAVKHGLWIFAAINVAAVLLGVVWARFSSKRAIRYTLRQQPKVEVRGLDEPNSPALRELTGVLDNKSSCETVRNTKSMSFESTSSDLAMSVEGAHVELAEPADILLGTSEELSRGRRVSKLGGGDKVKAYGVLTRKAMASDYRGAATFVLEGAGTDAVSLVAESPTRYKGLWDWAAVLGRVFAMVAFANIAVAALGEYGAAQVRDAARPMSPNPTDALEAQLASVSLFRRGETLLHLSEQAAGVVPMSRGMAHLASELLRLGGHHDRALSVSVRHGLVIDSAHDADHLPIFPHCSNGYYEEPARKVAELAVQTRFEVLLRWAHRHNNLDASSARVYECIELFLNSELTQSQRNEQLRDMAVEHRPCRSLYLASSEDEIFDTTRPTFESEPFGPGLMLAARNPELAKQHVRATLQRLIGTHLSGQWPTYWPLAQRAFETLQEAGDESEAGQLLLAGVELRVATGEIMLGDFDGAAAKLDHVQSVVEQGQASGTPSGDVANAETVSEYGQTRQLLRYGVRSARFRLALLTADLAEAKRVAEDAPAMLLDVQRLERLSFSTMGDAKAAIAEGDLDALFLSLRRDFLDSAKLEQLAMLARGTELAGPLAEHLRYRDRHGDCALLNRFERVSFERRVATMLGDDEWAAEMSAQQAELIPLLRANEAAAIMDALRITAKSRVEYY